MKPKAPTSSSSKPSTAPASKPSKIEKPSKTSKKVEVPEKSGASAAAASKKKKTGAVEKYGASSAASKAKKVGDDTIDDIFGQLKAAKSAAAAAPAPKKAKRAAAAPKPDDGDNDDDDFANMRGEYRKRGTIDGLPVYSSDELKIGRGGGTPQCPFDCDCCYYRHIESVAKEELPCTAPYALRTVQTGNGFELTKMSEALRRKQELYF